MNKKDLSAYMAKIGAKGGKKSRRVLTSEQARKMQTRSAAKRRKIAKNFNQQRKENSE